MTKNKTKMSDRGGIPVQQFGNARSPVLVPSSFLAPSPGVFTAVSITTTYPGFLTEPQARLGKAGTRGSSGC